MTDWLKRLGDWKKQQDGNEDLVHYSILERNKSTLVLSAGDSWTWGGGLDPITREQKIYGRLLADYYDADLINVGCMGWSNSWVLKVVDFIISKLAKNQQYDKIYVIITLTETARDIGSASSFDFNLYRDTEQLVLHENLYQQILNKIEQHWIQQIESILEIADDRVTFFVGQNFVWHPIYNTLKNMPIITTDVNWIEVLADYQNLPRPVRTIMGTGWIFGDKGYGQVNKSMAITDTTIYKNFTMPLIDKANELNKWLDQSGLNSKKGTKHPTEKGHELWASHIIDQISLYTQSKL